MAMAPEYMWNQAAQPRLSAPTLHMLLPYLPPCNRPFAYPPGLEMLAYVPFSSHVPGPSIPSEALVFFPFPNQDKVLRIIPGWTRTHYVLGDALELLTRMLPAPQCKDNGHTSPHPV